MASLENDLRAANEKITQITHEVSKKTELIQILTNDMDDVAFDTPYNGKSNLDLLQKKIGKFNLRIFYFISQFFFLKLSHFF